jgi:hypothetical protein
MHWFAELQSIYKQECILITLAAIQCKIFWLTILPFVLPQLSYLLDMASQQHWHGLVNPVQLPSQFSEQDRLQDWQFHNICETGRHIILENIHLLN